MAFNPTLGPIVDAAGGAAIALLGAAILWVRPRLPGNLVLSCFSILAGVAFVFSNARAMFASEDPETAIVVAALRVFSVLAGISLVALVLVFPWPVRRTEAPLLVPPILLAMVVAWAGANEPWGLSATSILRAPFAFVLLFLPLRYLHYASTMDPALLRRLAGFAGALTLYPAVSSATHVVGAEPIEFSPGHVTVATLILAACLWLYNAHRQAVVARTARNVGLLTLGMLVLGAVAGTILILRGLPPSTGPPGIARTLTVIVLAYQILRYQLLGIDVRIKWTLRQSTIAAAFVAVMSIVSESTQALFSPTTGTYLAILSAGALVFLFAPIQRAAERLANLALPHVKAVGAMSVSERESFYLAQARVAWSDHVLSSKEREILDTARERLGLGHDVAARLEREARVPPPGTPAGGAATKRRSSRVARRNA